MHMNANEEAGLRQALSQVEAAIARWLQAPAAPPGVIQTYRDRAAELRRLIDQGLNK